MEQFGGVNLVRSLGGHESGRKNVQFQPKNFRFSGKISDLPGNKF